MAKLYEHMSAAQNLEFFAAMYDIDRREIKSRIRDLLDNMGLKGREDDKVGTFSTGMKKRVQLARILLHKPRLIFLDCMSSNYSDNGQPISKLQILI
jgi:ABC-type multidrug transport system ATPase subunit